MSKKMLINASQHEESRVAIVEDGVLAELDIEIEGKEQAKGNIYKATVVRVEPGLQAAFVDYGADRMGFLQIGELHPNLYPKSTEGGGRPRINDILKRGQEILVQIIREERDSKGAALTTFLSLAGRYMVLMPESDTKGVSRKIDSDSHRKKLKEAMAGLDIPDNMGYIVRTAGIGQETAELHRDFHYLIGTYNKILDLSKSGKAPQLIYRESNVVIRSIRDYFNTDMDEVLIDDPEVFREAQEFFRAVMPEYLHLLKLHQERRPIFSRYQIEEQIETLASNKVPLPSGGSIVIDRTEALVAIDVNSGKMAGEHGIEATAYKTNLEAAVEVGRQLRLRDLGGLIVIDFIDMRERSHNREVEKTVKNALKNDKARVSVGKISQFGLLELSRQRIRAALAEGAYHACPHCLGSGRVKSVEAQAVAFLRRLHTSCAKGTVEKAVGKVPPEVATYLLNAKRSDLMAMEKGLGLTIEVVGDDHFTSGQSDLQITKREKANGSKPEGPVATVEFSEPAPALEITKASKPETVGEDVTAEEPAEKAEHSKRKRRRKKKPAGGKDEATTAEAESTAEDSAPEATPATTPVETATDDTLQEPAADSEEIPAEKKKRRRRRRKKPAAKADGDMGAGTPEVETADTATLDTEETAPKPVDEKEADSETKGAEPAKKPRRRRRKPAAKPSPAGDGEPQAGETVATTTPATPLQTEVAVVAEKIATATEPAKKPARRKKAPTAAADAAESPAATEAQPEKPVRKPRATAKKADTTATTEAAETAPKKRTTRSRKIAETAEDTTEVKKPVRRSRSKKPDPPEEQG